MNKTAIALLALLASSASLAATPWQKITQPVPGSAQSIGSFSNGCMSALTRCRYSPNIIRSCVPISVAISVTRIW
ncbi:hypothetical protein [Escherichia coli]|uniref:hypothetical protein n=1 Tax=Escherichia coli TaxID=562 RepID=UPI0011AB4158|nr:hypothetical protein [Escherichia coli]